MVGAVMMEPAVHSCSPSERPARAPKMIVRRATLDDLPAFLRLGQEMRNESNTSFPPIDSARVRRQIAATENLPETLYAAIAVDGDVIGMITGVIGDYAFSPERRAACDLLFVRPQHRGAVAARKLVESFCDWAAENGARSVFIGISTAVNPERSGKFFERIGFEPLGPIYRKEVG